MRAHVFVRLLAVCGGVLAALAVQITAFAQEAGTEVGGGVSSFGVGDWFGLLLRLALVIAVIWASVMGMRWYVRRVNGGPRRGARGTLEILETHALGPNRALHLVRLGDRAVLVGATPERITALLTMDDPEEVRSLSDRPTEEARPPITRSLSSLISNFGTGLSAMNAQRATLQARRAALREQAVTRPAMTRREMARQASISQAGTPQSARPGRFAGLRGMLARPQVAPIPASSPAPQPRPSLFDRTLAEAEAADRAAAGLRARAGYGQVVAEESRESRIAELQRAIVAARRTAG